MINLVYAGCRQSRAKDTVRSLSEGEQRLQKSTTRTISRRSPSASRCSTLGCPPRILNTRPFGGVGGVVFTRATRSLRQRRQQKPTQGRISRCNPIIQGARLCRANRAPGAPFAQRSCAPTGERRFGGRDSRRAAAPRSKHPWGALLHKRTALQKRHSLSRRRRRRRGAVRSAGRR